MHYVYWSSKWDERIPKSSHRLAPYRSHICALGASWLRLRVHLTVPACALCWCLWRASASACAWGGGADHEAGELKVGQRVDVFDRHESRRKWCDGEVVEAKPSEVKVHFYVRACLGIGMR